MEQEELLAKLCQIEEQARLTLEEFPKNLTRERQRMIIALSKYVRTEIERVSRQPIEIPAPDVETLRRH